MHIKDQPVGTNPFKLAYWIGRIDLRGIALFRMGLGLFLLFDVVEFAPNLRAWFSDEGVMPRASFLSQWARSTRFVPLDAFGTPTLVWIYWALAVVVAVAFTLGYRTRLASVLAFVIFAGFQERLPPLFDGSDTVLRVILFWHMFSDSGHVWSLDAQRALRSGRPLDPLGPALPVRLVGVQIGWVYFCSVFWKAGGVKWHDGTAVHYAVHLTHVFAREWAAQLGEIPLVYKGMTWGALALEASFLFLTHAPFLQRPLKALALFGGTMLHLGIFLTINVGHFSYLMPLTYLSMFEPEWAQGVVDRATRLASWPLWRARLEKLAEVLPAPRPRELAEPAPWRPRAVNAGWVALFAWFFVVSWYSMPKTVVPAQPPPLEKLIQYTSMWSSWDMFAPDPLSTDYHLSAPAIFEDGSTADLFGGDINGGGEQRGFFFTRWWKYMENVTGGGELLPLEWGRYLCREHNFNRAPGQPRLYSFILYKDNQAIPAPGQPWPKVERQQVWVHKCFDKPGDTALPPLPVAQAPTHLR